MAERYDWRFENAVSQGGTRIVVEESDQRYSPFRTNRYLSRFMDALSPAQDMNLLPGLDDQLQFDYLFYAVRKRKRFQKGNRADAPADLEAVAAHYKYSDARAREALSILTKEQIKRIKEAAEKGG